MLQNIYIYISSLLFMAIFDAIWLMFLAKDFYATHLGFLFSKSPNMTPIFFFYPIYALAVSFFVVYPSLSSGSLTEALLRGALLGLSAYGAYDLTNHATIANWPLSVTLADMAWGVFVTALVGASSFLFVSYLGSK